MPRSAKSLTPIEEMQLALIELPEEPAVIAGVQRFLATGTTAFKDEPRAMELCERLLLGQPVVTIARAMGMSPKTVREGRRQLVAGGKLGEFKSRVRAKLEGLLETTTDNLQVMADEGKISAHDSSVLAGILLTNGVGGLGGAHVLVEHRHEHRITAGAGAQAWAELAAAGVSTGAKVPKGREFIDVQESGSSSGSKSAGMDGSPGGELAGDPAGNGDQVPGRPDRGGGCDFPPRPDLPDTSPETKNQPKAHSADGSAASR